MPHESRAHRRSQGLRLKKLAKTSITGSSRHVHNFLTIYCQNISGAKSKIAKINELLTKSLFNVIALQETWFDETVEEYELVKNTNYKLIRQDRRDTSHVKIGGGGVALLIQSEINFKQHIFSDIKILQYICVTKSMNLDSLSY